MSLKAAAHHLASRGRGEDSLLVHMTPGEVHGLQALAMSHGGSLTRNPDTGLPEAGFLKNILPTLIGFGAAMTGVGAPFAAALGAGAGALTNRQNPLMGAIAGGLGAYGGASLGAGLTEAGASAAANAVPAGAAPQPFTLAGPTELFSPVATPSAGAFPTMELFPSEAAQAAAAPSSGWAVPELLPPTNAAQTASDMVAREAAKNAYYQQPVMDRLTQGVSASLSSPSEFMSNVGGGSGLLKSAAMAAAPVILAPPKPFRNPEDEYGDVPRYRYDAGYTGGEYEPGSAYTGEKRYFRPSYTQLAQGGTVGPTTSSRMFSPRIARDDIPAQAPVQAPAQAPVQAPAQAPVQAPFGSFGGFLGQSSPEIAAMIARNAAEKAAAEKAAAEKAAAEKAAAEKAAAEKAAAEKAAQMRIQPPVPTPNQAGNFPGVAIPRPPLTVPGSAAPEINPSRLGGAAGAGGLMGIPLYYANEAAKQNPEIAAAIAADTTGLMSGLIGRTEKPEFSNIFNPFRPPSMQQSAASMATQMPASYGRYTSGPARGMSGASADAMMYLSGQLPSSNSSMSPQYAQQYGVPEGERRLTTMPVNTARPSTPAYSGRPLTLDEITRSYAPQTAANKRSDAESALSGVSNVWLSPGMRETLLANPDFLANFKNGGELRTGGFVVPADVVSALGNGSTDAGLEALMKKFKATPIDGPGDGMSDSIPTTIEGKQKARVARGEAYLSPEQVQRAGGTKKLYAMLDRIRQNAHGKTTQQRQINPNKAMG